MLAGLLNGLVQAETFKLNDGTTVTGELVPSAATDVNLLINVGDNKYERVAWGQFSQDDLKKFMANKKLAPFAEPFIEVSQDERAKKTEVNPKPVDGLKQPPKGSLIGSLFQSPLGWLLVFLIYAANVYAGYEIGIFRAQPTALVAGLATVPFLGFLSNLVFLALPTRLEKRSEADQTYEEQQLEPQTFAIPGQAEAPTDAVPGATADPQQEVMKRGQFTFNKRFFETKFANYFGIVRREADRKKVLLFKTTKGELIVQRISRITASDIHLQVDRGGGASIEQAVGFQEILEIVLKH